MIGAGCSLRAGDVPAGFPGREQLFPDPDEWLNPGDSVVVAPGGEIIAGPLHEKHGLLFAEIEPARVAAAHRTLDVAGHYSRNDIFRLTIDRTVSQPVIYQPARRYELHELMDPRTSPREAGGSRTLLAAVTGVCRVLGMVT